MSTKNVVTIGMPVFNDVEFIEASLKSILNQTYQDFKLIISDDGSTDGSEAICRKYENEDSRVTYIRQEKNIGISKNMQFLLEKAQSEYFMWAGDDDLYDPCFVEECVNQLERDKKTIVAFCQYETIDERNETIRKISTPQYRNNKPYLRLKEFVKNADDGFGYGLFRTEMIRGVHFPTWWWPNKKTPYNNIYPTLCFYLAKGNYWEFEERSLFFKRVKTNQNVHHKLIGQGNAIKETFAYIIRRFNLVTFSAREIRKAGSVGLMFRIYPTLWFNWFCKSSFEQIKLASKSFIRNKILRKNKSINHNQ